MDDDAFEDVLLTARHSVLLTRAAIYLSLGRLAKLAGHPIQSTFDGILARHSRSDVYVSHDRIARLKEVPLRICSLTHVNLAEKACRG